MYKKLFLGIMVTLNVILFKFLLSSNDIIGIYKLFNLFLNVSSSIIFLFYILDIINSKRLLAIGFFLSFYGILNISSLLSSYIVLKLIDLGLNKKNIPFYYTTINIFIELIIVFNIYFVFYKDEIKIQYKLFIKNINSFLFLIIKVYILAVFLNITFSSLAQMIPLSDSTPANQEGIELIMNNLNTKYIYIINLVLLGPLIEEFFFRYLLIEEVLFRVFKKNKKLNKIVIILLSAIIFSLFHAIAASSLLYFVRDMFLYIGTSLALSFAYVKSNNIFVGYFVHLLNNLVAVLIMINYK